MYTDVLADYTEENLAEIEAVEEILGNIVEAN